MIVFLQGNCFRAKVDVFLERGCFRARMVVFEQKWLYSGKSGGIRPKVVVL